MLTAGMYLSTVSHGSHGLTAGVYMSAVSLGSHVLTIKQCNNVDVANMISWLSLPGSEDSSSTRLLPLGRLRSRKIKNPWSSSSEAEGDHPGCPPQRRPLSWPHIPCVRLERSFESLHKSPLTVDSHTAAGLDYEESLPHDLLEESTQPWVATVHASESHRHDDDGLSRTIHSPQADDQAAQLMRLIPQLDQSQI
ncbi:hypothetical protein Taro_050699 [Colocasia esculenta]|uniref:Uncharacterized protein n=1 Tax=Colocasia esculenta TaxID=4460 RepID=A0A843XE28_COLES|nr:hypothetical protein [Colocasia esculenta]